MNVEAIEELRVEELRDGKHLERITLQMAGLYSHKKRPLDSKLSKLVRGPETGIARINEPKKNCK